MQFKNKMLDFAYRANIQERELRNYPERPAVEARNAKNNVLVGIDDDGKLVNFSPKTMPLEFVDRGYRQNWLPICQFHYGEYTDLLNIPSVKERHAQLLLKQAFDNWKLDNIR